jgi:hypothetical protein
MSLNYQTPDEVYYANNYQQIEDLSTIATETNEFKL